MNLKSVMIAAAALAAPAAGASAQAYEGDAPPPPYAYTGERAPAPACDDRGFTIVGAHAGVTVLGFGLNGGARFTAPADCGGYGDGQDAPRFAPRPYAPPMAYAPQGYGQQRWGQQGWGGESYDDPAPCGCGPEGW